MKMNKCLYFIIYRKGLLHWDIIINESLWHYFKIDIVMHFGHGCALCEIRELYFRNMVILTKFLDFMMTLMFGTKDHWHNGAKFINFHHLDKPSYLPYLPCRK
jgi:hypothetical protein